MDGVEDRADQLFKGATSLAPESSKRLRRKCATADLSDILSLLNPDLPLCILIGLAKHLIELPVNQIGSIVEDGRWSTLMVVKNLYF